LGTRTLAPGDRASFSLLPVLFSGVYFCSLESEKAIREKEGSSIAGSVEDFFPAGKTRLRGAAAGGTGPVPIA
jgi:hypothetical protein